MIFAEFYHLSTGWDGKPKRLIPACGDRAVIILDGRQNRATHVDVARRTARERGYLGFSLHAGETFTRSRVIRDLETLEAQDEAA